MAAARSAPVTRPFGPVAIGGAFKEIQSSPSHPPALVPPVTFLIVPSRGILGRPARYDFLPLSFG